MHISRLYLHSARFKATANKEGRERIPGHIGLLKYMKLPSLSAQETEQMKKELKFKQSSQEEEKQATCRSIQSNHHNTCRRIVDRESCKELQIQSSDKEKIVDDRAIRYGPESDELENHPETTVSWHLASDSGAEALAFLQQGGSSSSGVLRASESFPAPSPAMDPVPPPWGFQPLVQVRRKRINHRTSPTTLPRINKTPMEEIVRWRGSSPRVHSYLPSASDRRGYDERKREGGGD
ncbi:hypothetical protein GW17_00031902 [Ensete ventricosum]|nr:hypothetical protein GW17_00031902 [Ensete ventricosum]